MSDYTMAITVDRDYDLTVGQVREALAEQGFGVLTEIDVRATMKAKLDLDVPAQIILGACRPQLAHRAMTASPSIAALLPCNVVVRDEDGRTVVEAIDPDMMSRFDGAQEVCDVAAEAKERLGLALAAVAALGGA
jgi:uncharacterized protein (DUF302 family)